MELQLNEKIVICDDDQQIRELLSLHLGDLGYQVSHSASGSALIESIKQNIPEGIILDRKLPDSDGIDVLRQIRNLYQNIPVLMITGFADIPSAVEATKLGVEGYLQKPFNLDELDFKIKKMLKNGQAIDKLELLKDCGRAKEPLIGSSTAMGKLQETLNRIKSIDIRRVLITGKSGVGKNFIAQAIHEMGMRRGELYTEVHCSASSPREIERQIFGVEAINNFGTEKSQRGLLEIISGGTLLLDEITALPRSIQAKLVTAIDNGCFKRINATKCIEFDVCILATSSHDLSEIQAKNDLSSDLFYRLNLVPIHIASLVERAADIPKLASHFLSSLAQKFNRSAPALTEDALKLLRSYAWPGNVRELKNILERVLILNPQIKTIGEKHLPHELRSQNQKADPGESFLPERGLNLQELESRMLMQSLTQNNGNQSAAAKCLGISRHALRYRLEKNKRLS